MGRSATELAALGDNASIGAEHHSTPQVHAFAITLQGNVEATIKKGLLRFSGAVCGGLVAVAFACMFPPTYVVIIVMALMEAMICWTVPTPLITR